MTSGTITHTPLADVREELTADLLTPRQRELMADQASLLLAGFHAHRWQKRALYGVEPLQRLQVLRRRAATVADAEFHAELREIFADPQDLHTARSGRIRIEGFDGDRLVAARDLVASRSS